MLKTMVVAGVLTGSGVALGAEGAAGMTPLPGDAEAFVDMGVPAAWVKYNDVLTWGKGQTVAVLDDGCNIDLPEYKVTMPWGPKVIATWNSVESNSDPRPIPPAYHGTTMPFPSSLNFNGKAGIAFNDFVAPVRCVRMVHIGKSHVREATESMKKALEWVLENREKLNITAVNLSPLDDVAHPGPVASELDPVLQRLREQNVWVSAPCGNHGYTNGISWPAASPWCFAIGASDGYYPGPHSTPHIVRFDRSKDTDILALAGATSSANAYLVGCAVVLREAMEKVRFDWKTRGRTFPDAILAVLKETGEPAVDKETGATFISINLLNALDRVIAKGP